jgi:hypothetical protein
MDETITQPRAPGRQLLRPAKRCVGQDREVVLAPDAANDSSHCRVASGAAPLRCRRGMKREVGHAPRFSASSSATTSWSAAAPA